MLMSPSAVATPVISDPASSQTEVFPDSQSRQPLPSYTETSMPYSANAWARYLAWASDSPRATQIAWIRLAAVVREQVPREKIITILSWSGTTAVFSATTFVPHSGQKFTPSGSRTPQFGQNICFHPFYIPRWT